MEEYWDLSTFEYDVVEAHDRRRLSRDLATREAFGWQPLFYSVSNGWHHVLVRRNRVAFRAKVEVIEKQLATETDAHARRYWERYLKEAGWRKRK